MSRRGDPVAQRASGALAPSGRQTRVAHGDQLLTVVEVGGGIREYSVADVAVIEGYGLDEICSSGRGQPLIPWPNRLSGGSYEFGGQHHQLPLSEPGGGNAIHGLVRYANWVVAEQAPGRVTMTHRLHPSPGYPFLLDLEIVYILDDDGLRVRYTATNCGDEPCPYGAGAHPYLRLGDGGIDPLVLHAPGRRWYESDGAGIPVACHAVDGTVNDFRQPRLIGSIRMDTAFGDLVRDERGRATVELSAAHGAGRICCWLDEFFDYLMIFTGDSLPAGTRRQGLAVEPMTCAPNAFRTGDGLQTLVPGQRTSAEWGITTFGIGAS